MNKNLRLAITAVTMLTAVGAMAQSPSTRLRQYNPGQYWDFTWRLNDNGDIHGGTAKASLVAATFQGQSALKANLSYTVNGGQSAGLSAFVRQRQDRTLDVIGLIDDLGTRPVNNPFSVPARWARGMNFHHSLMLDGNQIELDLTVRGSDTVTVKAGTFRAWRITNAGDPTVAPILTLWFAPDVGMFVKGQGNFLGIQASFELKKYR